MCSENQTWHEVFGFGFGGPGDPLGVVAMFFGRLERHLCTRKRSGMMFG